MWFLGSRTQRVIDRLPCKIAIVDKDGNVVRCNDRFRERFPLVTNVLHYIVSIDYNSYKALHSFLQKPTDKWSTVLEIHEQIVQRPMSYLNVSKRLNSMMRRVSRVDSSTSNMTAFKLSVSPYKEGRYVCDFINVTEQVRNEKMLAKIAQAQADIISSIYPKHVIDSMQQSDVINMIARNHESVTIMFADIVGFTEMAKHVSPGKIMNFLNKLFEQFDNMNREFNVFKLETVGDCYVAVGGLFREDDDGNYVCDVQANNHAKNVYDFAKACLHTARHKHTMPHNNYAVRLRIGIHSGPVQSGIIGRKMPKYCLFGDTMNTASRMESTGFPNRIQVSDTTHSLLDQASRAELEARPAVEVKGKGTMQTYVYNPNNMINDQNSLSVDANLVKFFSVVKESFEIANARSSV